MKNTLLLVLLSASALMCQAQNRASKQYIGTKAGLTTRDPDNSKTLADDCFKRGDYKNAAGYYNEYLKIDSTNVELLKREGYCLIMGGEGYVDNQIEALTYLNKALKIQPNDTSTNYYIGVVYNQRLYDQNSATRADVAYNRTKAFFLFKKSYRWWQHESQTLFRQVKRRK